MIKDKTKENGGQEKKKRRVTKKTTYKMVVKIIEMQFEKRNRLQKNKKKLYKI